MVRTKLRFRTTLLAFLLGALGLAALGPARQVHEQKKRIRIEESRLARLTQENSKLELERKRLDDPSYQEKLAREDLGYVKPGEVAYVVVPQPAATATAAAPKPSSKPWYQSTWDWVVRLFRR